MSDALPLALTDRAALDALPETLRGLYRQDGDRYVLDAVPRRDLHKFLDSKRDAESRARATREAYGDADPEEVKAALELKAAKDRAELLAKGDVDALVARERDKVKAALTKEISARDEALKAAQGEIARIKRDGALAAAATALGVLPDAVDDVLRLGREIFKVEGADLVAEIGGKREEITPEAWLKGVLAKKRHWLAPSVGGGAGDVRKGGASAPQQSKSKMSAQEKADYIKEHGAEAYAKLPR